MKGDDTYISRSSQDELRTHTSNIGITHVRAIHDRGAIHDTNDESKSTINVSDDSLLLGWGEATAKIHLFRGRIVDMDGVCEGVARLLHITAVAVHHDVVAELEAKQGCA